MDISGVLKSIKPFSSLGIQINDGNADSMEFSIPLSENFNDKNTMFAGSQYSAMVLCGWALAYSTLNGTVKTHDVVIKGSSERYLSPVKTDARVIAELSGEIIEKKNGNRVVNVTARLEDMTGTVCAEFNGEFIGIRLTR